MSKKIRILALLLSTTSITTFTAAQNITTTYAKNEEHYWSAQRDEQLKKLVEKFGYQWVRIAQCMQDASDKQCRERYLYYLAPNINRRDFTEEEDAKLENLICTYGKKWSFLAKKYFPNRTDRMLKNRHTKLLTAQKRQQQKKQKIFSEASSFIDENFEDKASKSYDEVRPFANDDFEKVNQSELSNEIQLVMDKNSMETSFLELPEKTQQFSDSSFLKLELDSDFDELFGKFFGNAS